MPFFLLQFCVGGGLGFLLSRVVLQVDHKKEPLSTSVLSLSFLKKTGVSTIVFQMSLGLIMGGLFVLNAQFFDHGWPLVFWQLTTFLLFSAAIYDLAFRLIPISLILGLLGLHVLAPVFFGYPHAYADALLGALVVGGSVLMMYLVTRGRGIGEADVFLAFVIGLMFGWFRGLMVFSAANFLGLLVVLPLIALFGKKKMKLIPLVFFLVAAILLEWYFLYTDVLLAFMGLHGSIGL